MDDKLSKTIIDSLKTHPDNWDYSYNSSIPEGYCKIIHETGVTLWVGNGLFFVSIYDPVNISFRLIEKYKIWKAFKKWRKKNPFIPPENVNKVRTEKIMKILQGSN